MASVKRLRAGYAALSLRSAAAIVNCAVLLSDAFSVGVARRTIEALGLTAPSRDWSRPERELTRYADSSQSAHPGNALGASHVLGSSTHSEGAATSDQSLNKVDQE